MKVTEEEIRPEKVFSEYLALTQQDVIDFFGDVEREEIVCPACGAIGNHWVTKSGFNYKKCDGCFSIFVSPRPAKSAFDAYYTDSPSTKFWATTFYKVTEAARREKLWKPKAQLIKNQIQQFEGENKIKYIVDIGGGYGVFDEEIKSIMDITPIIIEPSVHLATICRNRGLDVVEKFMEDILPGDLPSGAKCYVSFELFEHLHDPTLFLKTVIDNMNNGDLFIFTTLSGIGLDIQVLGEHAKALSPPHHLNFLNPKSITVLLKNVGFEVLDATTPGKIDVDILKNNQQHIQDEFWRNVLKYSSDSELSAIQQFIAHAGLSSHMMITCRKS
ncbi:MAG: class I SAM-dependent methyltransferase [Bacteroidota bacterium]|nr:class I SAM-dependent methyltransferase [Bacteroidota bacterium]